MQEQEQEEEGAQKIRALGFTEWKKREENSHNGALYAGMPLQIWLSRYRWKVAPSASARTKSFPAEVIRLICKFSGRDSRLCMRMPDGLYLRRAYRLQPRRRSRGFQLSNNASRGLRHSSPPPRCVVLRSRSAVRRKALMTNRRPEARRSP